LPVGEEKRRVVRSMFDTIAPRYDLMNRLMTVGLDTWWRRRTVSLLALPTGSEVLDLGCGTGDLLRLLDRAGAAAIGIDISAGMLARLRPCGCPVVLGDAGALPFSSSSFDGAVCAFTLRNLADLPAAFRELARVVRRGGRIALLEVSQPGRPVLRAGFRFWFESIVPRLGALLSDRDAYSYLPRSVEYLPAPAELCEMITAAGFAGVGRRLLTGGAVQVVTASRR
jgi:demethylmenaquinone methyltransferase/2-methoxy-6-polyprenyl-1,4-benzoquinol methylase